MGHGPGHAQDALVAQPDRKRPELHPQARAGVNEEERQGRTKEEGRIAIARGIWFPFLLLPRTPLFS